VGILAWTRKYGDHRLETSMGSAISTTAGEKRYAEEGKG